MTLTPLVLVGVMLYGIPLARWIDARLRGAALAGAAFLFGIGAIALHLFALSVMRVPWTRTSVLIAIAPLLAAALYFTRNVPWIRGDARLSWLDAITVAIFVAYAIFALWAPPFEWDFYGIWGLKGRWFFDARGIDWAWLQTGVAHPDYPPLVPLMFDFVAIVTGAWDDHAFGWLYPALCASLIAIVREKSSAPVTLAVAFPALNVWIGLGEAAVMAYGCAALLFLRDGAIRTAAIFLGLAAWSKNEGVIWIVTAAVALLIATRSLRKALALWPAAALIAPWLITRAVYGLQDLFARSGALERVIDRLADPVATFRAIAAAPPDQPYFWLVVLAVIVIYARRAVQRERFLLLALLLQAAALVAPLLLTPFDLAGHAMFSLNRIPHQLAPVAAFLAAVLLLRDVHPRSVPFTDAPERSQNR